CSRELPGPVHDPAVALAAHRIAGASARVQVVEGQAGERAEIAESFEAVLAPGNDLLAATRADDQLAELRVTGRDVAAQETGALAAWADWRLGGALVSDGRAGRTALRDTVEDPPAEQGVQRVANSFHSSPSPGWPRNPGCDARS